MEIIVDLMSDSEKIMTNRFPMGKDATLADLTAKIAESNLCVDVDRQMIYFNTCDITNRHSRGTLLSVIGIKHEDTVVVKHSHLHLWIHLVENLDIFKETREEAVRKLVYTSSMKYISILDNSGFLKTYASLSKRLYTIQKYFVTHYDRQRTAIENSTTVYFQKMFGTGCKITYSSQLDGSRRGVICHVCAPNESQTIKYFIKTHHGGGSRDSNTRDDIDIKEIYAYKLLQQLGIGAEIHLIPNTQMSKWVVYIGSREVDNFQTISDIQILNEDIDKYVTPVIQMLALFTILNMADHHSMNMGINNENMPFILDFFIINRGGIEVNHVYNVVHGADKFNKRLKSIAKEERLAIAKDFINKCNFLKLVDNSLDVFLSEYQDMFNQYELSFLTDDKTDDLKKYVEKIKANGKSLLQW